MICTKPLYPKLCVWLPNLLLKCRDADYEIVVVEDNSPDGTVQAANQLQVYFPLFYNFPQFSASILMRNIMLLLLG